jgi:hypothetical protein
MDVRVDFAIEKSALKKKWRDTLKIIN